MAVYATLQQFLDYTETTVAPPSPSRLLEVASTRVDEMLVGCVYDVDSNGAPVDADVQDALRRAACEQVLYMLELGDTTGAGSFTSQTVGRITWSQGRGANGDDMSKYAPNAVSILHTMGMVPTVVLRL